MLREGTGHCRPIERVARRHGYEIVTGGDDLIEARWYAVGARVVVLVPGWARGVACREAMIARQLWLHALATAGEEWCDRRVASLRQATGQHGGLVASLAAALVAVLC